MKRLQAKLLLLLLPLCSFTQSHSQDTLAPPVEVGCPSADELSAHALDSAYLAPVRLNWEEFTRSLSAPQAGVGCQGTGPPCSFVLALHVTTTGRVDQYCVFKRSSSCREQLLEDWTSHLHLLRFTPASLEGVPLANWTLMPVRFTLK